MAPVEAWKWRLQKVKFDVISVLIASSRQWCFQSLLYMLPLYESTRPTSVPCACACATTKNKILHTFSNLVATYLLPPGCWILLWLSLVWCNSTTQNSLFLLCRYIEPGLLMEVMVKIMIGIDCFDQVEYLDSYQFDDTRFHPILQTNFEAKNSSHADFTAFSHIIKQNG